MEQIRCGVVELFCLPTHNIAPHITLHDQPYHQTMKKYTNVEGMVISLLHPRKFAIQTWFCNCPQYFCLLHIVFEYTPDINDQGKMLVLPNQLLIEQFPHRIKIVSFQPILCHPHTQIRISFFTMYNETFPIWNFLPAMFQ